MARYVAFPGANGWNPRTSSLDGRYAICGVTFPAGWDCDTNQVTPLTQDFSSCYTSGFLDRDVALVACFDRMQLLAVRPRENWARSVFYEGDLCYGNYSNTSKGHWFSYHSGLARYVADGRIIQPRYRAEGATHDGEWFAYADPDQGYDPVVQHISSGVARKVNHPGPVDVYRVFHGPDGGYLFYYAGGSLWVNGPAGTVRVNLPNTQAQENIGALSWPAAGGIWVWTYAHDGAQWVTLGRPMGDARAIVLPGVAANTLSMQTSGWDGLITIMGATDNLLTGYREVRYSDPRQSFMGSSGQGPVFPRSAPIPPAPPVISGEGGSVTPGGGTVTPGGPVAAPGAGLGAIALGVGVIGAALILKGR